MGYSSHRLVSALRVDSQWTALEFRIVWPDGSIHHTKAASQTYRDETGRPLRMIGVNYDITALKEAEAELKASSEQLRALSESLRRAKEEEGIRIAHELHDDLLEAGVARL